MTPGELLLSEAGGWLRQAEKDLNSALALTAIEPSRSVFHSQQAAEKAVKAFLTCHQVAFRRTHDLADLGSQCVDTEPAMEPFVTEIESLTDYASAFRYPDAPYEPDSAEAVEALAVANRFCAEVRRRIGCGPEA